MTKARNLSLLSTVEVGATADQTKADIDALGIAADIVAAGAVAKGLVSQQVFTSSGTWTKPSGVTTIKVIVTGGGGGACATNSDDTSGGGGAGSTAIEIIDVSSISTVTVTVGAGQAARGQNGGTTVVYGNSSSFGSYCTAGAGANGGGSWSLGGVGGTSSGGDINIMGGDGQGGAIDYPLTYLASGTGGSSYWGGGGKGASDNNRTGMANGKAAGSGGGGGINAISGGAGAAGVVLVEEYK